MQKENQRSDKVLNRAKKIYELSKAKDIIKWYDNLKLAWFETQIKKTKEKRNKRIEKEIMKRAEIGYLKLNKYETQLETRRDGTKVIIETKDGRKFLVDED